MSYFYIFFYSYLLHIVVYIIVVWIDTIIYFSMKNNLKSDKKCASGKWSLYQQKKKTPKKTKKKHDFCFDQEKKNMN